MADFQQSVNLAPAPAVAGDFASANPRATVLAGNDIGAGQSGLIAGPNGLTVGFFAWVDPGDNVTTNNYGSGAPSGFAHRGSNLALITTFLSRYGNTVPAGYEVTLHSAGDFWVQNSGSNEVVVGNKAYANFLTGAVTFGPSGSPPSAASGTGVIAAETWSATGSILDNAMTITGAVTGTIYPGSAVSGTNVASGTTVVRQLSGTTGGDGTYEVTPREQGVASTTLTGAYGQLTISGSVTGAFAVGQTLSGTGVVGGTYISALGTGTGGDGTYIVNNNTAVSSTTITAAAGVETKWYAMSPGAAGELVKMSSWPLG